jgi:rod shape-determining protein MreD
MKYLSFFGFGVLLLAVESVLTAQVNLPVTRLDAVVALVVFLAVRVATVESGVTAFALGYALDVFTGRPTGLYPFLAMLMYIAARLASQVIDGKSRLGFVFFVAVASAAQSVLAFAFTSLTSRLDKSLAYSLAGLPVQVIFAAVFAALSWPLLRRLEPQEKADTGALKV